MDEHRQNEGSQKPADKSWYRAKPSPPMEKPKGSGWGPLGWKRLTVGFLIIVIAAILMNWGAMKKRLELERAAASQTTAETTADSGTRQIGGLHNV